MNRPPLAGADQVSWIPGYWELAPPTVVGEALACLWVSVGAADDLQPDVVLPDGCVDLIWQQGRGAFVAGPDTGPAPTALPPSAVLIGARFRPGAGGAALGIPLARLRDQRVDAAEFRPDLVRRLPFDLRPDEALFRMRVVATELATAGPPDSLVVHAARLVQDPRARSIDLVRALGVSERQLRRRFDAAVGYGPKTLQRVLRFQRFLAGMSRREDGVDLAQLAAAAGYADQAHLTREAGLLSGRSPAVLARDRTGVLAAAAGARIEFGQGSPWSAEHLRGGQPT